MKTNPGDSPAMRVMNEAIELAIEECSPFPDRAVFINADTPKTEKAIKEAFEEDMAAVVVSTDGGISVLLPPATLASQAGTNSSSGDTPAMRVMEEAIDLAIEERSPYPKRATFLDVETPDDQKTIKRALDEQRAVVLVADDYSTRVLFPNAVGA